MASVMRGCCYITRNVLVVHTKGKGVVLCFALRVGRLRRQSRNRRLLRRRGGIVEANAMSLPREMSGVDTTKRLGLRPGLVHDRRR